MWCAGVSRYVTSTALSCRTRRFSAPKRLAAERAGQARLLEIEAHLGLCQRCRPSRQKAKANTPLGTYARQYLDGLVGTVDPTTIEGYEKLYRTHIAPVSVKPVASITTADVTSFRANLLAPHKRHSHRQRASLQPVTVTRSPKTVKHIVGTLKRILDTAAGRSSHTEQPCRCGPKAYDQAPWCLRRQGTVQAPSADGQSSSQRM